MGEKILLLLVLALAVVTPISAQETGMPEERSTPADNQDEKKPQPEPAASTTASTPETPESFTPSEEISEDLSVSFPVDI